MYYIKSEKGYWKPQGYGYTDCKNKAGLFTFEDMERLGLNLDGCTLEMIDSTQRDLESAPIAEFCKRYDYNPETNAAKKDYQEYCEKLAFFRSITG